MVTRVRTLECLIQYSGAMARPIDPERHRQQRLRIIDAALTCFARDGLAATTAAICREAGIGSGTFFHYFPTKQAVLRAILEHGPAETSAWFAELGESADPIEVICAHAELVAAEAADPRLAGFVVALGSAIGDPEIAELLTAEQQATRDGLTPWVERGRAAGIVRTDWSVADTVNWIVAIEDAFVGAAAQTPGFVADEQIPALLSVLTRALRP